MKITGHRTRGIFERYNITDQSDTQDAGKMAEEFLAKEHVPNWHKTRHKIEAGQTECDRSRNASKTIKAAASMRYSGF